MKRIMVIETYDGKIHPDERHARGHLKNRLALECESLRNSFAKWNEHPTEFAEFVNDNIDRLLNVKRIQDDLIVEEEG